MPIYDYRCNDCGKTYDVLHKVREVSEDIACPSCGSTHHTRLIGVPSFAMGKKTAQSHQEPPPCADGSCCDGSCGLD
jgi:putative FmdB family regulatory protein